MGWNLGILIASTLLLAAGCLVPNRWLPAALPNDKLLHFAGFGGLGLLALPLASGAAEGALLLAGLLVLSGLIECLQQLVPDRRFSWRDLAANAAGLASAGLIGWLWTAF